MPVVHQQRLRKSFVLAACEICGQPLPLVSHSVMEDRLGAEGKALLQKGGLKPVENLQSIVVPQGDDLVDVGVVSAGGGKFRYWGETGWVGVDVDDLRQYTLNMPWFMRWVANAFDIPDRVDPRDVLAGNVWMIGEWKMGRQSVPIFFARHLRSKEAIEALRTEIRSAHKGKKVLVLTAARNDGIANLALDAVIACLPDILVDAEFFKIDTDRVRSLLGEKPSLNGYSDGFRTVMLDGEVYKFSPKQAEIIEALHDAGKPLHKTEFMALHSAQDDPKGVFRVRGEYVPGWGRIILSDGRGNYRLAFYQ